MKYAPKIKRMTYEDVEHEISLTENEYKKLNEIWIKAIKTQYKTHQSSRYLDRITLSHSGFYGTITFNIKKEETDIKS